MRSLCCSLDTAKNGRFIDTYTVGRKLGAGAFSIVKCVTLREDIDHKRYAAKIINKRTLNRDDIVGVKAEIRILKELSQVGMAHPHILRLFEVFNEKNHIYLITELLSGGELYDQISKEGANGYVEKDVRHVCKILFDTISYCHERSIAHRDLKPQNILLMNREDNRMIKIADFGFAAKAKTEMSLKTQCGTPDHVAPEILKGHQYGTKVDIWSLGVITYTLLVGHLPFVAQSQDELFSKIKDGGYNKTKYWRKISKEAKAFVTSLLTVKPTERNSAKGSLDHPWMKMSDETLSSLNLYENLLKFKKFNAKRKLRQTIFTLIAANKITNLIVHKELRKRK